MQYNKIALLAILLLGLGQIGLKAQDVIPASGGNASGDEGTVSYTIGQVIFSTQNSSNGSVVQGVQQPIEISVVGIDYIKEITLTCFAYPNPTTDFLILKIEASTSLSIQSLSYQFFDISGKFIESKSVNSNETIISTGNLLPTIYFLKIIYGEKEVKTFKIIKN